MPSIAVYVCVCLFIGGAFPSVYFVNQFIFGTSCFEALRCILYCSIFGTQRDVISNLLWWCGIGIGQCFLRFFFLLACTLNRKYAALSNYFWGSRMMLNRCSVSSRLPTNGINTLYEQPSRPAGHPCSKTEANEPRAIRGIGSFGAGLSLALSNHAALLHAFFWPDICIWRKWIRAMGYWSDPCAHGLLTLVVAFSTLSIDPVAVR